VRATVLPFFRLDPAAGSVEITSPIGFALCTRVTVPTTSPSALSVLVALATLWPTTFGTETLFEFARSRRTR